MVDKKYKAIIFDLDGTLINSLPYHLLSFKDILLEHGIRVSDEYLRKRMGLSTSQVLKEIKKKYHFSENIEDFREERRYHYFKFLGRRDITFAGVKKMISKLRLDYRVAIATGSSKATYQHSTDKNLQELFDLVVTINDVKHGKPNPEQLLYISKKFHVKPSECLMIGDSIYDALAAKNAKMDCFGVLTGYTSAKELLKAGDKMVLKKITDLPKFL
jgi:beta-phosphoglucomutase